MKITEQLGVLLISRPLGAQSLLQRLGICSGKPRLLRVLFYPLGCAAIVKKNLDIQNFTAVGWFRSIQNLGLIICFYQQIFHKNLTVLVDDSCCYYRL